MSSEEQAEAYMEEARLTLESARAIEESSGDRDDMAAQVVKNAYDAIEQAISAAIASTGERIPRKHPAKVNRFIGLFEPTEELEQTLLYWLRRRSDSQYVESVGTRSTSRTNSSTGRTRSGSWRTPRGFSGGWSRF